jgi:hypothetical protein
MALDPWNQNSPEVDVVDMMNGRGPVYRMIVVVQLDGRINYCVRQTAEPDVDRGSSRTTSMGAIDVVHLDLRIAFAAADADVTKRYHTMADPVDGSARNASCVGSIGSRDLVESLKLKDLKTILRRGMMVVPNAATKEPKSLPRFGQTFLHSHLPLQPLRNPGCA